MRKMSISVTENSKFELISNYFPQHHQEVQNEQFKMETFVKMNNAICTLESEDLKGRFPNEKRNLNLDIKFFR